MSQAKEIKTFEEAARAVEPIFRNHNWRYARSTGLYADHEEIEETMRSLAFSSVFNEKDEDGELYASTASGRILVTRDALGPGEHSRSVYLHLFDI